MENRYEKYKDSGIAWIGEIPEHWDVCKLSTLFFQHKQKNSGSQEINLLSLSYGNIKRKDINTLEGLLPESFENYNIIDRDDIVFRLTDLQNDKKSLRSALCKERGIITSAYVTIRKRTNINPIFFNYLFRSYDECKVFYGLGDGVRQGMNFDDLRNLDVLLPQQTIQQYIATYLDQKCDEIDELIALQEEMITKLQSYKQSVITEVVTKGLDKNASLKDSGIGWIGEIPMHWKICKHKNMFLLSTGTTPKGFDKISEEDNLINWYTPSDILDSCNDLFSSQRKLSEQVIEENGISLFPVGTLMYVGIGASAGKLGYANESGYSNQQITGLIPFNCYSKFYFYYLSGLKEKIRDNAFFTTLPIINNAYLGQELIPYPPMSEQQTIVDYLDQKCSEIDELISIKQQKIEKLKDYKKSLIFECVTGKRKV